jgi:hypothetical protein
MLRIGRLAGRRQDRDRCCVRCQGQVRVGACAGSSEAPALRSRLASRQDIRHKIPALISPYAHFSSLGQTPKFCRLKATSALARTADIVDAIDKPESRWNSFCPLICPTGSFCVQPPLQKYSASPQTQIRFMTRAFRSQQNSREMCGESAKACETWLFENLIRSTLPGVIIRHRVGAARRPMTGSSR